MLRNNPAQRLAVEAVLQRLLYDRSLLLKCSLVLNDVTFIVSVLPEEYHQYIECNLMFISLKREPILSLRKKYFGNFVVTLS